jgi:hypothetical protein
MGGFIVPAWHYIRITVSMDDCFSEALTPGRTRAQGGRNNNHHGIFKKIEKAA